jgi:hypothetical protein
MPNDDLESRVLDFERTWRAGGPCEIADFLDCPITLSGDARHRLLVELICVDLELRWKCRSARRRRPERTLLEVYAAKYRELGSFEQVPLELIGQEYRVRCQWGDRPTHSVFLSRFRARQNEIEAELAQIDHELTEESAGARISASRTVRLAAFETEINREVGVPLLSHRDVRLRRMIGAGRMGKVYEAWRHSTSQSVAVKFLRKSLLHQPEAVQRFIAEARNVARLQHPNIVGIHGLGRAPGGAYFIIMDLVPGSNLEFRVRTSPVALEEAIRLSIETCAALEHAHSRGIIHCDLKPSNLLLDHAGGLRVTDFGLSRSLTENAPWSAEVEGTAPYMAPEQASRYWGRIDRRTDVYGVGAVLFALLTGRPPWVGHRLPDVLARVISGAPVISPASVRPDLPASISELCLKCLSKPPEQRYQTVNEIRSALSNIVGRESSAGTLTDRPS